MRFFILFFVSILLFSEKLHAQVDSGAKFMAMANAGVALESIFSLGSNQAGIATLQDPTFALTFQNHHGTNIHSIAVFGAFPTFLGAFGLYANRKSFEQDFIEYRAGLTLSHLFASKLAVAGTLNYHHNLILESDLNSNLSFDIGFQYQSSPDWKVGLLLTNSLALAAVESKSFKIPVQVKIGTSYLLSNQVLFAIESEYNFNEYYDFRLGIDYQIVKKISLRGGLSLIPFKQYAGIGINLNRMTIDTATSIHPQLGISSQISMGYVF